MSIEAIKKALEGVTHVWGDVNKPVLVRGVSWIAHANYDDRQAHDNAIYLKAVNPSAITSLISEIDRLQRENEALREALTPFSRVADMSNKFPSGGTVGVNVDRCRDARQALASTGGDHHAE